MYCTLKNGYNVNLCCEVFFTKISHPTSWRYHKIIEIMYITFGSQIHIHFGCYYCHQVINSRLRMVSDFLKVPQLLNADSGPSNQVFLLQSSENFYYSLLPKTETFPLNGKYLGPGILSQNFKIARLFILNTHKK